MENLGTSLIVIAVTAAVVIAIFVVSARSKRRQEDMQRQMAAEHGWEYTSIKEPLAWGMRLGGRGWTLEAVSRSSGREAGPGSSDVSQSTRWQADRPGSTVLIGERPAVNPAAGFGGMLLQQALRGMLGGSAGSDLSEVKTGNPELDQRYMIWAQDPQDAESLLTPAVVAALRDWKGKPPLVRRTSSGLQIEVAGRRLQKVEETVALVRLGESLLAAGTESSLQ